MSPEQAMSGKLDERSDLFTLGTVMYRMVTGSLPFQGTNPSIVLKNIIDGSYDDPMERTPSLSPKLAAVITRCLASDPDDRFSTASEVEAELRDFLESVAINSEEPRSWSLFNYVNDPDAYDDLLQQHLITELVHRGRRETEAGATAEALRTFNRVLALDSDNTDVITIISTIRGAREPSRRRRQLLLWASPFLVLIVTVLALIALRGPSAVPTATSVLHRLNLAPMAAVAHGDSPISMEERSPRVGPVLETPPQVSEASRVAVLKARIVEQEQREAAVAAARSAKETEVQRARAAAQTAAGEAERAELLAMVGTGQLHVISTAGFLRVTVDGVERGLTPVQPFDIPAGKHVVRTLETEYTLAQTIPVLVPPDEKTTLRLQPNYKPSTVELRGFPEDALVHLDGQPRGQVRSIRLNRNRTYAIDVYLDGGLIQTASVVRGVERGQLLPGGAMVWRFQEQAE
jgi:hypothetical protein